MRRRKAKIVCTIGRIAKAELGRTVEEFVDAGMDVARINMAHYDLGKRRDRQYLKSLIRTIRQVARNQKKTVAVMGDIQGPKVRIRKFLGKCQGKTKYSLEDGERFILTCGGRVPKGKKGAAIIYEGNFSFFENVKEMVKTDSKGLPRLVEFWFADGKVILGARIKDITCNSAHCRTVVAGELKVGQGISVKNSTIKPGEYALGDYVKDRRDVNFLLQQKVDLLALSFVNNRDDVRNLQEYIRLAISTLRLAKINHRFPGMKEFPIISKIETEEGVKSIDEIMEVSYGIMVARGDLALRIGIEPIGVVQKDIIDKCVTKGKPVITATQMLLSMMDFREPRRPEATDVTNAIFDGTDVLMLSEETADPASKFPVESIRMMGEIARTAEQEIERLNELRYKYEIDQRHDKTLAGLHEDESRLQDKLNSGKIANMEYRNSKVDLERREIADHISYNACKMAHEMKCSAIVVLTFTGGTARMVSRFKPDAPILAGVYSEQTARVLTLSYGVQAFRIKGDISGYPFDEYRKVIDQAKKRKLLEEGERVILVAGYPRKEPGTVTFLNVYRVH